MFDPKYSGSIMKTSRSLSLGSSGEMFTEFTAFSNVLNNPLFKLLGTTSKFLGPATSTLEAKLHNDYLEKNRRYLEINDKEALRALEMTQNALVNKAIVDWAFAGVDSMGPLGKIAAGTFGVVDLVVQSQAPHTPKYGKWKGIEVDGWRALNARVFEAEVRKAEAGQLGSPFWGPKF